MITGSSSPSLGAEDSGGQGQWWPVVVSLPHSLPQVAAALIEHPLTGKTTGLGLTGLGLRSLVSYLTQSTRWNYLPLDYCADGTLAAEHSQLRVWQIRCPTYLLWAHLYHTDGLSQPVWAAEGDAVPPAV